jgi:hypothetical protein
MTNTPDATIRSCFICGKDKPTCIRKFAILYYIMEEPICEECFNIPSDEWKEDRPWKAE